MWSGTTRTDMPATRVTVVLNNYLVILNSNPDKVGCYCKEERSQDNDKTEYKLTVCNVNETDSITLKTYTDDGTLINGLQLNE